MKNKFLYMSVVLGIACAPFNALAEKKCPVPLQADSPIVPNSMEQSDINSGVVSFDEINDHGELLFVAAFNVCDGQGRPETTGGGAKRSIPTVSEEGIELTLGQISKLRTSAPDSDSCAGCHTTPEPGGAGDFVANVFVLAQTLDPVTFSVDAAHSNSRNTLGMHGAGPIEMLSREMTADLQSQAVGLSDGHHTLTTKGIDFGIDVAGGAVVQAYGVDPDLVVKPFHQAGKVISLREFSDNAYNHHHGMQAEERFDLNAVTGFDPDFDADGVEREMTIGDVTAVSIWQAQLSTPTQVLPDDPRDQRMISKGQDVFSEIGCASCHTPEMVLNTRDFVEPNPYNPPGTCASAADGCPEYSFDMTELGDAPRLEKADDGKAIIRAYTDLKRHNLCDDEGSANAIRWFCNEQLAQGRADEHGKPGSEFFLTRKLWDVGNTAPYGHRGDLSTITEAILMHGGEAREARDNFATSRLLEKRQLVMFLKSLQIVPQ